MTFIKGLFKKKAEPAQAEAPAPVKAESAQAEAPAPIEAKAEAPETVTPASEEVKIAEAESTPEPEVKAKRSLFGSKKSAPKAESDSDSDPDPDPQRLYQPKEDANSFFLDSDSAKTFGNIDYMRSTRKITKTFPKVGDSEKGAEVTEVISSLGKEGTTAPREVAPEIKPSKEAGDRRRQDNNMDMFRSMAKGMKK